MQVKLTALHVLQPGFRQTLCCVPAVTSRSAVCFAGKGFGAAKPELAEAALAESKVDAVAPESTEDSMESRIKTAKAGARKGKIIPQVKVQSAIVDAVSGKTEPTQAEMMESYGVLSLFFLFANIILFGLFLAASGFLPEEWDEFAEKVVYPNYSTLVLLFLGGSSFYGIFKTGMLPGQAKPPN